MPIKKGSLIVAGNVNLNKVRVTEFQKRYPDQLNRYIKILEEHPDDHLGVLLLKPSTDGYFEILDGHHRYLAYVMMGRPVAFALIIDERPIYEPRGDDQGFVQGLRNELAAQAGIDANAPAGSHLPEAAGGEADQLTGLLRRVSYEWYVPQVVRDKIKQVHPGLADIVAHINTAFPYDPNQE